jgi:hypothetical protein
MNHAPRRPESGLAGSQSPSITASCHRPGINHLPQKQLLASTLRSGGFSHNSTPNMMLGNACYEILLTCADGGL